MKTFVLSILVLMTWGSLSHADVGLRSVRCYADFNTKLIYSGIYYVVSDTYPEGLVARRLLGVNAGGKCVLGENTLMPKCMSIVMNVFPTLPCTL